MDIQSNNELIAEFMGLKTPLSINQYSASICENNGYYHKDWNWLMDVVDKINDIDTASGTVINIYSHVVTVNGYSPVNTLSKFDVKPNQSRLTCVYKAVVDFIKWYNENK